MSLDPQLHQGIVDVVANDTDADAGDAKTLLSVQNATHGTATVSGDNVVFTPDANYNGAATHFQQALRSNPNNADAHYNLAGLYEQAGDRPAALRRVRACTGRRGSGCSP